MAPSDSATTDVDSPASPATARLWAEFAALYVGIPLLLAFALSPRLLYPILLGMTGVGLMLLYRTPGWRSARFVSGWSWKDASLLLAFVIGSGLVIFAFVQALLPHRFLGIAREQPQLWLMIMALYPIMLALPQEILFRALFFERYGGLFHLSPDSAPWKAIAVNAVIFGFAHLFYWNSLAIGLSAIGGAFFAYAYVTRQSFPLAFLMHAIAGHLVFTLGLGRFFYHGAIPTG